MAHTSCQHPCEQLKVPDGYQKAYDVMLDLCANFRFYFEVMRSSFQQWQYYRRSCSHFVVLCNGLLTVVSGVFPVFVWLVVVYAVWAPP